MINTLYHIFFILSISFYIWLTYMSKKFIIGIMIVIVSYASINYFINHYRKNQRELNVPLISKEYLDNINESISSKIEKENKIHIFDESLKLGEWKKYTYVPVLEMINRLRNRIKDLKNRSIENVEIKVPEENEISIQRKENLKPKILPNNKIERKIPPKRVPNNRSVETEIKNKSRNIRPSIKKEEREILIGGNRLLNRNGFARDNAWQTRGLGEITINEQGYAYERGSGNARP